MSKPITLISLLLLSISVFGQDDTHANFILKDGDVFYQKVFEMPGKSADEIKEQLTSFINQQKTVNINASTSDNTFHLDGFKMKYKEYGHSTGTTAFYILNGVWNGAGRVDIKEGKYRVTLGDIHYSDNTALDFGGVSTNMADNERIEAVIVRNNKPEFRSSHEKYIGIMSQNFDDLFDATKVVEVGGDDW